MLDLDVARIALINAIDAIKDEIHEILKEEGYEPNENLFRSVIVQTKVAIGLARRNTNKNLFKKRPEAFAVFMSLSKITNMLEDMYQAEQKFGKITKNTILKIQEEQVGSLIPKRMFELNARYLIEEAVPVILDFGGAKKVNRKEYKLTEAGKHAAKLWIEYQLEEQREHNKWGQT